MNTLKFITCGSVDDGKSTLIGRLLLDSKAILADQLASASHASTKGGKADTPDLAAFTDGLQVEREQGITIDVAWRYFSTPARKFIIGDTPGHEQYTRNMVTAASHADAAIVMVDATKIDWQSSDCTLLPQTRRHTLLLQLLRVPTIIFAVNKLDAVTSPNRAFDTIKAALHAFCVAAGVTPKAVLPVSALAGYNVVSSEPGWADYHGPSLLEVLETLEPTEPTPSLGAEHTAHFSVQWVERPEGNSSTHTGRRIYWGQLLAGNLRVGDELQVHPSGQTARIADLRDTVRRALATEPATANHSYGVVLDREIDVSRGDWLTPSGCDHATTQITATVAWLDQRPVNIGDTYWALHGHRWTKARVIAIDHQIDIQTLATIEADRLQVNDIGLVQLKFQSPLPVRPYDQHRGLGSLILVDPSTHATAGAVMTKTVS